MDRNQIPATLHCFMRLHAIAGQTLQYPLDPGRTDSVSLQPGTASSH